MRDATIRYALLMVARPKDIQIYLHQDNVRKEIIVDALSAPLTDVHPELTQDLDDVLGKSFNILLPERIIGDIQDYVEFSNDGYDITQVLPKIQHFAFKTTAGEDVPARIRMHHDVAFDEHIHAIMVVYGSSSITPQLFRDLMSIKEENHGLDGAVSTYALHRLLNELKLHVAGDALKAMSAVLQVENFEQVSKEERIITKTIVNTIRETDVLSYDGDGLYTLLLLEVDGENIDKPINRLRKSLRDAFEHPITFSVACTNILADSENDTLISSCHTALEHTTLAEQLVLI